MYVFYGYFKLTQTYILNVKINRNAAACGEYVKSRIYFIRLQEKKKKNVHAHSLSLSRNAARALMSQWYVPHFVAQWATRTNLHLIQKKKIK